MMARFLGRRKLARFLALGRLPPPSSEDGGRSGALLPTHRRTHFSTNRDQPRRGIGCTGSPYSRTRAGIIARAQETYAPKGARPPFDGFR